MDWNDILEAIRPHIPGLVGALIVGVTFLVRAWFNHQTSKQNAETARLNANAMTVQAEADRDKAEAARLQAESERSKMFNQLVDSVNKRAERYEARNAELEEKVAQIIPLEARVREMGLEIQLHMKDRDMVRDQHARELQAAEAKFEAAKLEWAAEKRELEARIEVLERQVSSIRQDIRATPIEPIPVVKTDELPKAAGQ